MFAWWLAVAAKYPVNTLSSSSRFPGSAILQCCDPGWMYNLRTNSCYFKSEKPANWTDALNYCQKTNNSNLVSVHSDSEAWDISPMIDDFLFWVGLSRPDNRSKFVWSDGSEVDFTWFDRKRKGSGNCVAWSIHDRVNTWTPIDCDYEQYFICKSQSICEPPVIAKAESGSLRSDDEKIYSNQYLVIENPTAEPIVITFDEVLSTNEDSIIMLEGNGFHHHPVMRLSSHSVKSSVISYSNFIVFLVLGGKNASLSLSYEQRYNPGPKKYRGLTGKLQSFNYPGPIPKFAIEEHIIICPKEHHLHIHSDTRTSFNDVLTITGPAVPTKELASYSGIVENEYIRANRSVIIKYVGRDAYAPSDHWQIVWKCVRNDGLGDEVSIP